MIPLQALKNKKRVIKHIKFTFILVCMLLAGYMTLKETFRYLENSDASSISFKEFAKTSQDTYPTFSVCITDDQKHDDFVGLIYSYYKNDIQHTLSSWNILDYMAFPKVLQGQAIQTDSINGDTYTQFDARNISIDYFNSLTIDLKELVNMVEFQTVKNTIEIESMNSDSKLPFYVSYQDPETLCFTRKKDEGKHGVRISDLVSFYKYQILDRFHGGTVFNFYLHHPGQLLRVLDTPIFKSTVDQFKDLERTRLIFKISQVSILRKREDANVPCNRTLHDDDLQLRIEIAKKVGCIPVYWNKIMSLDVNLDICNYPVDLRKIRSLLEDISYVQSTYQQPCNEMKLAFAFDRQTRLGESAVITAFVEYMDTNYQEIVNERDFGFESLWSAVGGFVGIFVGASLPQIPIMIAESWYFVRSLRKSNE